MARTRHIGRRMSQRGIKQALVDLTLQFGEDAQDKYVLGRRGLMQLIDELRDLQRTAMQALDKGGVIVVQADGALITAYDVDSFDRGRIHAR
jgi:tellurite resistance protein